MPTWMFWLEARDATVQWCEALLLPESSWYVLERRWFTQGDEHGQSEVMVRIGKDLFPARLPEEKAVSAARFELGLAGYRIMAEGPCLPSGDS